MYGIGQHLAKRTPLTSKCSQGDLRSRDLAEMPPERKTPPADFVAREKQMTAKVVGVSTSINEDGSYSVLIEHLQDIVSQFQVSAISVAYETNKNIRIPELSVIRIDIAHKGSSCELMVSTTQTGTVVLLMKDDHLRKMKTEIDRTS